MTDIIKDFEEKISGNVISCLKTNREFEFKNVNLFQQELTDLRSSNRLIIIFGNHVFNFLEKHFGNKSRIEKVPY